MHPAYSVIAFTTLSGAGYGLLVWLCALAVLGQVPTSRALGLVGFGIAFALISIGLLSSTLHLGRPERAWRAFSQWRTSWLSREGVVAVATYVPAGLLAVLWVAYEKVSGVAVVLALAAILGALSTVYCTGMIYASLRTIRQWHQPLVPWVYLALALATGAVLLNLVLAVVQAPGSFPVWAALAALLLAAALKLAYWRGIDEAPATQSAEEATGLGRIGVVRPLEPPHSRPNFVMREMGYEVARRNAANLRLLAFVCAFVAPVALLPVAVATTGATSTLASVLAFVSMAAGVGIERWLFFAEAQHVVTLYYRGGRA